MTEPASISRQFARWAAALRYEDLPAAVQDKARALLLHALTGGLLGANTRSAQALVLSTLHEEGRADGCLLYTSDAADE